MDLKVLVFSLGSEEYGVPIQSVKSIDKVPSISRVPNVPSFVRGVTNIRGDVVPVIDLRERLGLEATKPNGNTHLLFVSVDDLDVGMIIDEANDVIDLNETNIDDSSGLTSGNKLVSGVARLNDEGRLLVLLDLTAVLSRDEFDAMASILKD